MVVTVPGDSEQWLARWVLSFGGNATVISPEWAIRAVAEAARASLRSHVS
ncbi:MAG TPA: WYL domain-containing protein [Archangium sp.]